MNQDVRAFFQRLQLQPAVVAGHVVGVEIDAETGQQRYARVAVGAQVLRVPLNPTAPALANGDAVRLEQTGLAASADYRLAGVEAGGRPNSGVFGVLNDGTTLGGGQYAGGDYIFGKLDEGNLFIENQTGRLYHRTGLEVYGIEYPNGDQLYGHAFKDGSVWIPDGPNVFITPGGVYVRNALEDAIRLLSDGSAFFKGDFYANSLRIGELSGARLFGGEVVDFDAGGNPIITPTRYGLRLYDASGLPQIALLTGTVDNPHMPALLVGADNAASYLRWLNGILQLRGYAIIDGGQLGGYIITAKRITSTNNRVILVNENDLDFAEGLLLITGERSSAGTIAWRKSATTGDENKYAGILTTYWQPETATETQRAEMLIGVSDLFTDPAQTDPAACIRLEANTPTSGYGAKAYLELESAVVTSGAEPFIEHNAALTLRTNTDVQVKSLGQVDGAPLVIRNAQGTRWIGPGDFCYYTTNGQAGRLATNGLGIECATTGVPMWFQFAVPAAWQGANTLLTSLKIYYKTTLAAAYIAKISLVSVNIFNGTQSVEWEYGQPLGQNETGVGMAQLCETAYSLNYMPLMLRVDLVNCSDWGHVVIYGFEAQWTNFVD